jgi:ankyrin repeat protein
MSVDIQSVSKSGFPRSSASLLALSFIVIGSCKAATLDECIYPEATFARIQAGSPAVAVGASGLRILLHRAHPALCASVDAGVCRATAYVLPGDRVQVARRCGQWVSAKYAGKRGASIGWIDARQLAGHLPPDLMASMKPDPDILQVQSCAHLPSVRQVGTLLGKPGERVEIHQRSPLLCSEPDVGLCAADSSAPPGSNLYFGDRCGAWVYVSPSRAPWVASGWVDATRVASVPTGRITPARSIEPLPDIPESKDPLVIAVVADDLSHVRALVAAGHNVNKVFPAVLLGVGRTVLELAIQSGKLDMVQALLALGADPNAHDPHMYCSLALDMAGDAPSIVDALIRGGADVNCGQPQQIDRPLIAGVKDPTPAGMHFLDQLIAAGANINIDHGSVLRAAVAENNLGAARILLASGANPNLTGYRSSPAPVLMDAIRAYPNKDWDPSMILMLLVHGADPNYRDSNPYVADNDPPNDPNGVSLEGQTALTAVAGWGFFDIARILLDHGANPAIPRQDGKLPAAIALERRHFEVAALIERYSKRPTIP